MAIQNFAPKAAPRGVTATFIYYGTDAVGEGEPFVLDLDKGPNAVVRPTTATTTSKAPFVGVAARSYGADTGSRQIELYLPGSFNVNIKVLGTAGTKINAGSVVQHGYKATTGSKVFKAASSPHALTALVVGDAVTRADVTPPADGDGTALVAADLPLGPYAAGESAGA